jgi:hypothetical protein
VCHPQLGKVWGQVPWLAPAPAVEAVSGNTPAVGTASFIWAARTVAVQYPCCWGVEAYALQG